MVSAARSGPVPGPTPKEGIILQKSALLFAALTVMATVAPLPALALENIRGSQFVQTSQIALAKDVNQALTRFKRSKKAYGSFYASRDGRSYAWHDDMFTQADADRRAKTVCEWAAKSACVRVAQMRPNTNLGELAIPAHARSDFANATRKTKPGQFGAYAISPLSAYGTGSGYSTSAEARDRALVECQAGVADGRSDHDPALRKIYQAGGFYKCRLIQTFEKR